MGQAKTVPGLETNMASVDESQYVGRKLLIFSSKLFFSIQLNNMDSDTEGVRLIQDAM